MTYETLKKTEAGYLASNSKTFREYGKVLKYIKEKYDAFSSNCMSDDILISDLASKYIEAQKREMMFVSEKDDYKLRIRFAKQFIKNDFISKTQVKKLLENYDGEYKFESINKFLSGHYLYNRIRPEVVESIILDKRAY